MSIFDYDDADALGTVSLVDTASVVVRVSDIERLRKLQVNRLVCLQSSKPGQHLIGMVQRIARSPVPIDEAIESGVRQDEDLHAELNTVKVVLIGTLIDRLGVVDNVFRRSLETVPEIEANCFAVEGDRLTRFMRAVSRVAELDGEALSLGTYSLDDQAAAFLDGNRLFQRHCLLVGSTGSGKSWTAASILEQIGALSNANALVIDVHGEYAPLCGDGIRHFRIAGPADLASGEVPPEGVLFLPYWLLGYESMIAMLLDRSDMNAPNQAMLFSRAVIDAKRAYLTDGRQDMLDHFTIDSPIPYALDSVLVELRRLNAEMVPGKNADKQGEYYGKLSRFIARLESKKEDRRLGFMFRAPTSTLDFDWLPGMVKSLLAGTRDQPGRTGGVKVVDFSEVPSDILPLIVSLVCALLFSVLQWARRERRQPVAIFCDEAHLYMPERSSAGGMDEIALQAFHRIAKEGRKYGVGLVVMSQRPSEVSRTVLSQCNNVLAMRLTNGEDQSIIKRLLPDSLGGFGDVLPLLDTGEALVVGDASLLPSRVQVRRPLHEPLSRTVQFWDRWSSGDPMDELAQAVQSLRRQTKL